MDGAAIRICFSLEFAIHRKGGLLNLGEFLPVGIYGAAQIHPFLFWVGAAVINSCD